MRTCPPKEAIRAGGALNPPMTRALFAVTAFTDCLLWGAGRVRDRGKGKNA